MKKKKLHQTTWNNRVWGIANAYGDPWTSQTFHREEDAVAYLAKERAAFSDGLGKHKVVPVSVTVRVITKKP